MGRVVVVGGGGGGERSCTYLAPSCALCPEKVISNKVMQN